MENGRYNIIGKVTSLKRIKSKKNRGRTYITRMEITDDEGMRYQGTRPYELVGIKVGDKVTITADIKHSERVQGLWGFRNTHHGTIS